MKCQQCEQITGENVEMVKKTGMIPGDDDTTDWEYEYYQCPRFKDHTETIPDSGRYL